MGLVRMSFFLLHIIWDINWVGLHDWNLPSISLMWLVCMTNLDNLRQSDLLHDGSWFQEEGSGTCPKGKSRIHMAPFCCIPLVQPVWPF